MKSAAGYSFTHFARSGKSNLDIMEEMISPTVGAPFVWETWRRRPVEPSYCRSEKYIWEELNVDGVGWSDGNKFKETQDHSKMGISIDDGSMGSKFEKWNCVGDLNRMTSQNSRGGGYACFVENSLWQSFNDSFVSVEECTSSW